MMLLGGLLTAGAVVGGGAVCWMGVPVKSGTVKSGVTGLDWKWRVRFACWRWIAETWIPRDAKWKKVGEVSGVSSAAKKMAEGLALASLYADLRTERPPGLPGSPGRMVKVIGLKGFGAVSEGQPADPNLYREGYCYTPSSGPTLCVRGGIWVVA